MTPRAFLSIVLFASMVHFVIDMNFSIWPVYKTMAHLDLAVAGVMYAVSVIIGECSQLYFGKLVDKGYQRRLLVLGIILGATPVFFPYLESYWAFFIALLVTGIGSAAFHPTMASFLSRIEGPRRALSLGIFQMSGNLGMGMGQLAFVAAYKSFEGHTAPLFLLAVASSLVVINFRPVQSAPRESREPLSLKIIPGFFRSRPLRNLYFVQVFNQTAFWSLTFLLPDLLLMKGCSSIEVLGGGNLAFFLGGALGCAPAGYLKFFFPASKIIVSSLSGSLLLFYLLLLVPMPFFVISVLLFALGALLGAVMPLALDIGTHFVPTRRGAVTAYLMGLVWMVSEGIGVGGVSLLTTLFTEGAIVKALLVMGVFFPVAIFFAHSLIRYEKEQFTY